MKYLMLIFILILFDIPCFANEEFYCTYEQIYPSKDKNSIYNEIYKIDEKNAIITTNSGQSIKIVDGIKNEIAGIYTSKGHILVTTIYINKQTLKSEVMDVRPMGSTFEERVKNYMNFSASNYKDISKVNPKLWLGSCKKINSL